MNFECIVKEGHIGAGKYNEKKIYIEAKSILDAINIAKNKGGVKKGHQYSNMGSIIEIKQSKFS